jgi:hypothetical protein
MFVTYFSDQHVPLALATIVSISDHLFRILSSFLLYKNVKIKIYRTIVYLFCMSVEDEHSVRVF